MVDQRLNDLRGTNRRDFLRWSATIAACLGLERARFLNVLNDTAGSAAADSAACAATRRSIHLIEGNGGLSNWALVFPFPKVIGSTNTNFSHYALGKGVAGTGYDKPFTLGPDTPWQTNSNWKISAFVCGNNETHTGTPSTAASLGPNSLLASVAAIQQASPSLLPVLTVGNVAFGTAPGAPSTAAVNTAADLIGLFNSAASRALLQTPENGALAEAYYKAFLGLNAAAGRSTMVKQHNVGKVSMKLLGQNLSAQLTPTTADEAMFGITATSPTAIQNMGRSMITTLKAFALGLTSSLIVTGFRDDPHGLFAGGDAAAMAKAQAMGKMLNGLHDLAKAKQDPACSAKTLADNIVFTIHGDTVKQPFARGGWPDGTPMGSNMLWVMGGGYTKTGMIGDMVDQQNATAWDPATGNVGGAYTGRGAALGAAASAAALFAVAKGDMRRVRDFYNGGAIDGVVNTNLTG
ncbi:MAG: hypothetical protein JST00_17350 [Deltaproteobacteria bacterium]|nr:hypothetical protein [Deltaproteobacteria bacterium]